jgi:hypothetical protein
VIIYPEPDRAIVFVHNPKTAGTSIRKAIGVDLEKCKYRQHVAWRELKEGDKVLPSFGFVRNPWDRMWSMYKWFLVRMGGSISFEEWLEMEELPWVMGATKLKVRPWLPKLHRLPQTWWLDGVRYVGRFERLREDLEEIVGK